MFSKLEERNEKRKEKMRNEKKEKKSKKERKERKERNERKESIERKGRKRRKEEREKEDFPSFRRSTFESSRTKVGTRSGIYVCTPKSWSFDKLQKVGYFPTRFIFSLKAL